MMGSDHYCLKWNNHWANLLRVFNSLLRSETFVDVTLACEGKQLNAHRLVLSASSPYFKDLLVSHPDKHPIVILKDVRYTELVNLVQFIYNGEVSVDQKELSSFLSTARELQIKGLADESILGSLPNNKRKSSTNSPPQNDQPTNLSIRKRIRLSEDGTTNGSPLDLHKAKASPTPDEDTPQDAVPGTSGLSEDKEQNVISIKSTDDLAQISVLKQPKDKPPDKLSSNQVNKLPTSDVVMEEQRNGSSPTPSTTMAPAIRPPSGSPMTPSTGSPMAFLHQTLAGMRYHPHLPLMPPEILERQGLMPPNNILNFVDILKAVGSTQPWLNPVPSPKEASPWGLNPTHSPKSSPSPGINQSDELKPLTCSICARIMPSVQVLEEHVRIHEEEKPYTCDQCGQRYKYQSAYQRHKEQNHTAKLPGEKPYRCDVCGQCFKYHKSFTKHRSNHDLLDNFMKNEDKMNEPYFSTLQKRLDMIKDEVKDDIKDEPDNDRSRNTSENGDIKEEDDDMEYEEFADGADEDEIGKEDQKLLFCLQCKNTFRDAKDYENHCLLSSECSSETMKEVVVSDTPKPTDLSPGASPGEHSVKSFLPSSPVCKLYRGLSPSLSPDPTVLNLSKLFMPATRTPDVRLSAQPNPDEERPFKCQYCQKGFKGRENLKLHIRTHTGEKPYNCGVCGKAFGGRSDMNRHLRIHTGEKPYPCKVCGKKFARADYLSKHITTHLGMSFPKPVHSLQQSLQNLENMQLQSAQAITTNAQDSPLVPNILSTSKSD